MTTRFFDRQGVEVRCGRALARGGEGVIHEIEGQPGFVAKLYHQKPGADKVAKLAATVEKRTKELLRIAAWPVELVSEQRGGPAVGIVLPRIDGYRDIHLLYGPKSRLEAFPLASWPFLIRTAANLARGFAVVHQHGHVIGDVNDKVALVSDQALVKLIDCDSFQIAHRGGVFTCDVGVLTHQPPELQGVKSFRGLRRSENHDNFGLAVLIFQMLFMARHPFSGSYGKEGDMPLERAIQEYRFVYGADAEKRGMSPPPFAMDLSAVTREMALMFERAFSPRGARGDRPNPREWIKALQALTVLVRRCGSNPCHAFLKGRSCPFCAIERQAEAALFNLPILSRNKAGRALAVPVNLANLWKEIGAVDPPGPTPPLPEDQAALIGKISSDIRAQVRFWGIAVLDLALCIALLAVTQGFSLILLLPLPFLWPRGRLRTIGRALARRCLALRSRWEEEGSPNLFLARVAELKQARTELEHLDQEHARKVAVLDERRRQHQLEAFLGKFRIAASPIRGLSPSTKTVLESYGVETARDVSKTALERVPGLGSARIRALLQWRAKRESRFLFDPNRGVDPVALARIEREIQQRRAELVQKLADGPARLRNCARQVEMRRLGLQKELESLVREIGKTKAAA